MFFLQNNETAGAQGYNATATKKDAMGAQGNVVDQQAAPQQSAAEYAAANRASAVANNKQNRGSEFKKTA